MLSGGSYGIGVRGMAVKCVPALRPPVRCLHVLLSASSLMGRERASRVNMRHERDDIRNDKQIVSYMCAAGSLGLHPASIALTAAAQYVLVSHRPVPIATDGIVAVVAVVAVSYPVIYQGSVLVLTELAD